MALAALALLGVGLAGCGGSEQPFKVGVVVDCVGVNRPLHDSELSGAELPLIERGAKLLGSAPTDGVSSVEVGGRPVELVPGCTELWEFSTLIAEVRRLVEREGAEAILAAGSGPDEIVLAEVARLYPEVVFLPVVHGPREVTLHDPPRNLFRFAGDFGQGVAGLAGYAYRRLGWRDAAIVLFPWDIGWGYRDAFAAEFCALGGRISTELPLEEFAPGGADVAKIPAKTDGVAVFAPALFSPGEFLDRLGTRFADPSRHVVVGPNVTEEPILLDSVRPALTGVTGSAYADPARLRRYLRAYARAFPGMPTGLAGGELVTGYHDAMKALLVGLEDAGGSSPALPEALARERVQLLGGPVRLDANRQAVVSTSLVRIQPPGSRVPGLAAQGKRTRVNQSLGGLLPASLRTAEATLPCEGPTT